MTERQTQAVRIERYCKDPQHCDSETHAVNSQKIRDFYATKKEGLHVPWPVRIPRCVDYLQVVTIECECQSVNSVELLTSGVPIDTATIFPNGMLYAIQSAENEVNNPRSSFFGKKETLEQLVKENRELVVLTRGGNIMGFDRERDLILTQGESDLNLWYNDTLHLKACALARA